MKRKPASKEDPVVAEVRAARAALVRKGGGTIDGFFETARAEAARVRRKPVKPQTRPRRKAG